jgi:hypothetical protein
LFAIRKVGQRKTLSGKFGFLLAVFVFWKVVFGKPLSKLSCVYLLLEKLVNRKLFSQNVWFSFRSNYPGKHFHENQDNFLLTGKCFLLTNFSNSK